MSTASTENNKTTQESISIPPSTSSQQSTSMPVPTTTPQNFDRVLKELSTLRQQYNKTVFELNNMKDKCYRESREGNQNFQFEQIMTMLRENYLSLQADNNSLKEQIKESNTKSVEEMNNQLRFERDESEKKMQAVLNRNSVLLNDINTLKKDADDRIHVLEAERAKFDENETSLNNDLIIAKDLLKKFKKETLAFSAESVVFKDTIEKLQKEKHELADRLKCTETDYTDQLHKSEAKRNHLKVLLDDKTLLMNDLESTKKEANDRIIILETNLEREKHVFIKELEDACEKYNKLCSQQNSHEQKAEVLLNEKKCMLDQFEATKKRLNCLEAEQMKSTAIQANLINELKNAETMIIKLEQDKNETLLKVESFESTIERMIKERRFFLAQIEIEKKESAEQRSRMSAEILNIETKSPKKRKRAQSANKSEFEVSALLTHTHTKSKTLYLVRWKGYDSKFDSWVEESELCCSDILQAYKMKHNM